MGDDLRFQLSGDAAENYDRYSSVMLDPFIDEMLRRTAPGPGMSLLDVACGTGRVARAACSLMAGDGIVHGLDVNPGMLATAAALASREGCDVGWYEAPAEAMPLPDDVYDVVICSMGVMFFTDLVGGLAEMVRVAKPRGTVMAVVFGPVERNPYMAAQAGRLDDVVDVGAVQLLAHACRLGTDDLISSFDDLPVTEVEGDTVERSITIPRLDDYLAVHIGGLPYAAAFQTLPDDARRAYAAQVARDLSPYRTSEAGFEVPFALHFVSARVSTDSTG